MDEQKIRDWIEEKLDEGYSEEKIRKTVDRKGYDSSLVDEVKNESTDEENEFSEDDSEEEFGTEKIIAEQVADQVADRVAEDENSSNYEYNQEDTDGKRSGNIILDHWKLGVMTIAFAGVFIVGALYMPSEGFQDFKTEAQDLTRNIESGVTEVSQEQANANSEGETQTGFNGTEVVIKDNAADPSRASVKSGEKLGFTNKKSVTVEISFKGDKASITAEPDETVTTTFSSITYYEAVPVEGEGKSIQGSVYVE